MKHNWCRSNPIEGVEILSDQGAVRMNVLSPQEEAKLFMGIDALIVETEARKRTKEVRALRDIRDIATLMLNQGCRPEELGELPQAMVDLERGLFTIEKGESKAAAGPCP